MIPQWKKVIRAYFTFSSGERNGMIVLLLLLAAVVSYPHIKKKYIQEAPDDLVTFRIELDSFRNALQQASEADALEHALPLADLDAPLNTSRHKDTLFYFDPNTATQEDFSLLGLSDYTIRIIFNYRNKGGRFRNDADFRKMYSLKESEYNRLQPFIKIEATPPLTEGKLTASAEKHAAPPLLDLNRADSAELTLLPLIGPVMASRIVRYRNQLNGFYSITQLNEVYGMRPETFDVVKNRVRIDSDGLRKLNINAATADELKQHPYFRPFATMLVNYRTQHGPFSSTADLKDLSLITDSIFEKIVHYVSL